MNQILNLLSLKQMLERGKLDILSDFLNKSIKGYDAQIIIAQQTAASHNSTIN
jgi:hypothetical protein